MVVAHLLGVLKSLKGRKGMYLHPVSVDSVVNFLTGLSCAVGAIGNGAMWAAQEKRGWKKSSVGPIPQMREKGMTDEQIMDELIDIEIEMFESINARKSVGADKG
jgi:hypothetical protein